MTIEKWLKTPKGYVAIAMLAYLLIASIGYKNLLGIKNAIVAVFVAFIVDIVFNVLKKRKWTMPDGAVITGLIIALILSSATSTGIIAATAVLAILSKHLLVYKKNQSLIQRHLVYFYPSCSLKRGKAGGGPLETFQYGQLSFF
ncbi:RnfABCDGE type electron transport complex subunit D [Neobacillus ginsengisoli]|uniref:Uncharacterized protein n=1 Tax=Neobacillus ginsengisoli TaxID=904295 RepID=A0ABT9XYH4_9BACI|nr:RnfABCDGE type electron transport complex subunit D [Neobacillus ginsengisoli]MDQ0199979.1 hypothetical protein [Neobacillus ginsengisoli]